MLSEGEVRLLNLYRNVSDEERQFILLVLERAPKVRAAINWVSSAPVLELVGGRSISGRVVDDINSASDRTHDPLTTGSVAMNIQSNQIGKLTG